MRSFADIERREQELMDACLLWVVARATAAGGLAREVAIARVQAMSEDEMRQALGAYRAGDLG